MHQILSVFDLISNLVGNVGTCNFDPNRQTKLNSTIDI